MSAGVLRKVTRRLAARLGLRREAPAGDGREQGADWYDAMYARSDEYRVSYHQSLYYFLWTVIADRLRRAGARRVLDIGCGPGQLAALLLEPHFRSLQDFGSGGLLLEQGVERYVGVDFSSRAVEMARRCTPRGEFHVGDARSPEIHGLLDYDHAICTEVLEHVEDDLAVVSHFRPGRRCICSVPNFPYAGHVRHFAGAAEVAARYGPFFDGFDVAAFRSPRCPDDVFFLFEGVRNGHTVPAR